MCDTHAEFLATALPESQTWDSATDADPAQNLPGGPAVLLFVDERERPVSLFSTQQLKRFVRTRLAEPVQPQRGRANLAEVVRGVRWRGVHNAFDARWWYYRVARVLYPREYRKQLSFGRAWFLHVDWQPRVAEIRVTERVWSSAGEYVGPWATRKACQAALEGLWDLFDLCRHPEQIRRAPDGTACAYAEMGRCDAPCDGSVPLDAYVERCRAAWQFAGGGAERWLEAAEQRMRALAAEQQYELAAKVKAQLSFARGWAEQWGPHVRPAARLNYFIALPVTRRRAWVPYLFRGGHLIGGPVFPERRVGERVSEWLGAQVECALEPLDDSVRMEQTWLVCQLFLHRERQAAVVVELPDLRVPDDMAASVGEAVAALRERPSEDEISGDS